MYRLVLVIVALLSIVPAANGQWITQTVDNEGEIGRNTFTWFDKSGNPHIVYRDGPEGRIGADYIYHSAWTGSGWERTRIDARYTTTFGACIDSSGTCHLAYRNYSYIYYAYWDSLGPHTSNTGFGFSGDNPTVFSLALDRHGKPHIAIRDDYGSYSLYHQWQDTLGAWRRDTVTQVYEASNWCSIAIDSFDRIYIAYQTYLNHLKLAYYDGVAWGTQYIDQADNVGEYCRIIVDSSEVPHIVYYDAANTQLKYATWSDSTFIDRKLAK